VHLHRGKVYKQIGGPDGFGDGGRGAITLCPRAIKKFMDSIRFKFLQGL